MKLPDPAPQHLWLQRLLGEWLAEPPDDPANQPGPSCSSGKETVRPIGDLWVQAEGSFDMPDGSPARTVMTLGYEPATGRFQGTWIGSMATQLWIYDGELNQEGNVLSLFSEGPDFSDPTRRCRYKDVIELLPDGRRTLSGNCQAPDGSWQRFMQTMYRRA